MGLAWPTTGEGWSDEVETPDASLALARHVKEPPPNVAQPAVRCKNDVPGVAGGGGAVRPAFPLSRSLLARQGLGGGSPRVSGALGSARGERRSAQPAAAPRAETVPLGGAPLRGRPPGGRRSAAVLGPARVDISLAYVKAVGPRRGGRGPGRISRLIGPGPHDRSATRRRSGWPPRQRSDAGRRAGRG